MAVATYTSAVDKMKVFSAFIREGLENGDLVDCGYPDEESETFRAKLKEYGIDVEKYERKGALVLDSLSEWYMLDGKFDVESAIRRGFELRVEAKRKGYKHFRAFEDLGDFSFLDGQWQTYMEYWDDPRWETPSDPYRDILDYTPFVKELVAFNVESMDKAQLTEIFKAFWIGNPSYTMFIDLLDYTDAFSRLIGMPHKKLVGRTFLLEFDPACEYEKVIDSLAKEAIANVYPVFVFTSPKSLLHARLTRQEAVSFFLLSTTILESTSENAIYLPVKNTALILDSLNKVIEQHAHRNVVLVFDKLSELVKIVGFHRAYKFLLYVLDLISSKRATTIFLLNKSAHEPRVTSQIRGLFHNQLTYGKDGLKIVKIT
jgi:KaiC/GvpD/RAD55 family RecA-like ATPase